MTLLFLCVANSARSQLAEGLARSLAADDVPTDTVDLVVTLCTEEVYPSFLGSASRLHWPTPDPAGHDEPRLQRFRDARDCIKTRLVSFLGEEGLLREAQS